MTFDGFNHGQSQVFTTIWGFFFLGISSKHPKKKTNPRKSQEIRVPRHSKCRSLAKQTHPLYQDIYIDTYLCVYIYIYLSLVGGFKYFLFKVFGPGCLPGATLPFQRPGCLGCLFSLPWLEPRGVSKVLTFNGSKSLHQQRT